MKIRSSSSLFKRLPRGPIAASRSHSLLTYRDDTTHRSLPGSLHPNRSLRFSQKPANVFALCSILLDLHRVCLRGIRSKALLGGLL